MIAETTQIAVDPDCIDFGIGQPQLDLLPRELLWKATQAVLDDTSITYGTS